jgi:hypothetical protein
MKITRFLWYRQSSVVKSTGVAACCLKASNSVYSVSSINTKELQGQYEAQALPIVSGNKRPGGAGAALGAAPPSIRPKCARSLVMSMPAAYDSPELLKPMDR